MLTLILFYGQDSLSVLWRRIIIQPPDNKDLQEIVKVRYPDLGLHAGKLIGIIYNFIYTEFDNLFLIISH